MVRCLTKGHRRNGSSSKKDFCFLKQIIFKPFETDKGSLGTGKGTGEFWIASRADFRFAKDLSEKDSCS